NGKACAPYRDLPPLAGLGSFAEAMRPGLSVEECVRRWKRLHYAFRRMHEVLLARLAGEPIYELKMAFSYHSHLCAEHVTACRARVGEMREPPLGLEVVPHEGLALAFDEIRAAPTTAELLLGLYEVMLPEIRSALERYRNETHVLADQPSRRLCRFALLEVDEMLEYGRAAIERLVGTEERRAAEPGIAVVRQALAAAGGVDGLSAEEPMPAPFRSADPQPYVGTPRRDERFPDPYNRSEERV